MVCISQLADHDEEDFRLSPGYIEADIYVYSPAFTSMEEPGTASLHCLIMASRAVHPELW